MFGELDYSFSQLDAESRQLLVQFLQTRNEYFELAAQLNDVQIAYLQNPTPAGQQVMNDYSSTVVAPVRLALAEQAQELVRRAIDVEKLQEMVPMLLAAISQAVDVPLLLAALSIDPDVAQVLITKLSEYFKRGM